MLCCCSDCLNQDYLLCQCRDQFKEVSICYKKHIFNKSISQKEKMGDDDEFYDLNDKEIEGIESAQFTVREASQFFRRGPMQSSKPMMIIPIISYWEFIRN